MIQVLKSAGDYFKIQPSNINQNQHSLKVLSDENQGGSKLVSIDSFFFTV